MADNGDFGYFGTGTEGYVHYMQTFEQTQSAASGSVHSKGRTGTSGQTKKGTSAQEEEQADLEFKCLLAGGLAMVLFVLYIIAAFVKNIIFPLWNGFFH